jgi:hypothetical protein
VHLPQRRSGAVDRLGGCRALTRHLASARFADKVQYGVLLVPAVDARRPTVLKGSVRFRLGKPDRGIGSARIAPAFLVG